MAIQVARFVHDGREQWGVVRGSAVTPLPGRYASTADFIVQGIDLAREEARSSLQHTISGAALAAPSGASLRLDEVTLLSPVTEDRQFVCQGINYASHVRDSGMDPDRIGFNTIFTKASSCITSAWADVVRPAHVRMLDYEIELGLILRRPLMEAADIRPDALHEWLAGVTIVNDVSARDVQLPQVQFYKGKSYRTFGPIGPFLVLLDADEWKRWPELRMRLHVDGGLRQDAYCGEMIFKPHQTLTELSALHDLHAGDVIATGTPAGCAARAPGKLQMWMARHVMSEQAKWRMFIGKGSANPAYLQPGNTMTASIRTDDGAIDLGEQCNRIVAA